MAPDQELPRFPAGVDEPPALAASRAVVTLFFREGSAAFSVKDLAAHVGLAERTFYRYFPRKEDAVRPYLEAALAEVARRLREAGEGKALSEAIVESHGAVLELASQLEVGRLLEVLSSTERLRAVWIKVLTDAEAVFAEVVAERLDIPASSTRARFIGAAMVAAGRIALEAEDRPPSEVFAECLGLLEPRSFEEVA